MNSRVLFVLLVLLLLVPNAAALKKGHMKLLAVAEQEDGHKGITADLYLEIQPGEGKVFIESFPLTKMDTQISTRFAKEIACNDFEIDCDAYNFFYTIKADTTLVGGPSAGAAAAVLTVAVLKDLRIDESIAMSGTINSGGVIGPVGGLKAKIKAAPSMGLKKILIPKGERVLKNTSDDSGPTDLVEIGKKIGVEVIEVNDMREALSHFTSSSFSDEQENLVIDKSYSGTMRTLAEFLCNKSGESSKQVPKGFMVNVTFTADNLTQKGVDALTKERFYSAASYCFGADVRYRYIIYESMNLTIDQVSSTAIRIKNDAEELERNLPTRSTITDLQSYATVKERLLDAYDNLNLSLSHMSENKTSDALFALAYAEGRVFSAEAWSQFFGKGGAKFDFDKESLENSCTRKISEAEERHEYAKLYLPESITGSRKDIVRAYEDFESGNFELCLAKASKAKAESDLLLSALGIEENSLKDLLDKKLEISQRTIIRSTKRGVFPIVGYSYFEYAQSLKDTDPYSALLYTEYALELSNMDIYFRKQEQASNFELKREHVAFAAGILIGVGFMFIFAKAVSKKRIVKKAQIKRKNKIS